MARRGRKPKSRDQKLKDALERNQPNMRVLERQALFAGLERERPIEYVKAPTGELRPVDQTHDTLGQLYLLGLLDNHGHEATELLGKGRFWGAYIAKRYKSSGVKTASFERRDRSQPSTAITPEDLYFEKMDADLWRSVPCNGGVGIVTTYERDILWDVIVHPLIGHGSAAIWTRGLIDKGLLERGRVPRCMVFPTMDDEGRLNALIRGLCILVEGSLPGRYENRRAA